MKLVRNMKTEVVHRPDCSSRGTDARPWNWAVPYTLDEVKGATTFRDDGGADRTAPLDELAVWAQEHRCPVVRTATPRQMAGTVVSA